jgi:hypothetical protein
VADRLAEWFLERGTDGFIVQTDIGTDDFDRFTAEVLPVLAARGLFRTDYESTTLRGNLGLTVPANRYADAASAVEPAAADRHLANV